MEAAPDPSPEELRPLCYHPARASAPPFADPSGDTPDSVSWEDPDPDVMVTTWSRMTVEAAKAPHQTAAGL